MITAHVSSETGVLYVAGEERPDLVWSVHRGRIEYSTPVAHWLSHVNDWASVSAESFGDITAALRESYHTRRLRKLIEYAIDGLSAQLTDDVLREIESLLEHGTQTEPALNLLLIAPLSDPNALVKLRKRAAHLACVATLGLIAEIEDNQPQLRRLSSAWLEFDFASILRIGVSPPKLWTVLATNGVIRQLLKAPDADRFRRAWNGALFQLKGMLDPQGLVAAGKAIATTMFAGYASIPLAPMLPDEPEDPDPSTRRAVTSLRSVTLQIAGIEEEIKSGNDRKAEDFIRQLCDLQLSAGSDGAQYAVKSLCNVASKANTLCRTDWESKCLETALLHAPDDAFVLVQKGDLLKRLGQLGQAKDVLQKAIAIGAGETLEVAKSSLADVYATEGQFAIAREKYQEILGWQFSPIVQTALADILRREGLYDDAIAEFNRLLEPNPNNGRAYLGRAECFKQLGRYNAALRDYDQAELCSDETERDRAFRHLGRAHVLASLGRMLDAASELDKALEIRKFDSYGRLRREVYLAVARENCEQLMNQLGSTIEHVEEWQRHFLRGLVQLSGIAGTPNIREGLRELGSATVDAEVEDSKRRLAAALSLLAIGNTSGAVHKLTGAQFDGALRQVEYLLRLQAAVVSGDSSERNRAVDQLRNAMEESPQVKRCVEIVLAGSPDRGIAAIARLFLLSV